MTRWWIAGLALASVTPAAAQVMVLNGPSTAGADSRSGQALRVVSANANGARVSIRTEPSVALVCDDRAPRSTCTAWVQAGTVVRVELRRPRDARTLPGQGTPPQPGQWGLDCAGTPGPDCTVALTAPRTVLVDWEGPRAAGPAARGG